MSVEMTIAYEGQLLCRATHGPSGTVLCTDAPLDNGGRATSFSPTDLMVTAVGTCILTIMGLIAQQHNLDLRGTTMRVVKEMIAEPVRRIGALQIAITLPKGLALSADDRACLERAAQTCPAKQSLHPDVAVTVTYEYPQ